MAFFESAVEFFSILLSWFNAEFFSSLFGAGFGAWAAYIFQVKHARKSELVKQLNNYNQAVAIITHTVKIVYNASVKFYRPSIEKWYSYKQKVGNPDVFLLPELNINADEFASLLREKISFNVDSLVKLEELLMYLRFLKDEISSRNALILSWKEKYGFEPDAISKIHPYYTGEIGEHGGDTTYPSMMQNISDYSSSIIFLGINICEELKDGALTLRDKAKQEKHRIKHMIINNLDKSHVAGTEEIENWEKKFFG